MFEFENHSNYNCEIVLDDGQRYHVYANWIHNQGLDQWKGWNCHAGDTRLFIDKDFAIYGGTCRNDRLGSAIDGFDMIKETYCKQDTCTGCTDDLIVSKSSPKKDIK